MEGMTLLTFFVLAVFVGFEVVSKVSTTLHTPLMSGANAIHGIILIGAILVTGHSSSGIALALGLVAVVLACEIFIAVGAWSAGGTKLDQRIAPTPDKVPNIQAIGNLLYSHYLYVFEGAGLVLLVAMIGAIVLTHRARGGVKGQKISRQVSRRPQDATRNMQPPVGQGVEL